MKTNKVFIIPFLILILVLSSYSFAYEPFAFSEHPLEDHLAMYFQDLYNQYTYFSKDDNVFTGNGWDDQNAALGSYTYNLFNDIIAHENTYSQSLLFDDTVEGSVPGATHFGSDDGYIHFDLNINADESANVTVGLLHWSDTVSLDDIAKANAVILELSDGVSSLNADEVNSALADLGIEGIEFMEIDFEKAEDGSLVSKNGEQNDGAYAAVYAYGSNVGADGLQTLSVEAVTHVESSGGGPSSGTYEYRLVSVKTQSFEDEFVDERRPTSYNTFVNQEHEDYIFYNIKPIINTSIYDNPNIIVTNSYDVKKNIPTGENLVFSADEVQASLADITVRKTTTITTSVATICNATYFCDLIQTYDARTEKYDIYYVWDEKIVDEEAYRDDDGKWHEEVYHYEPRERKIGSEEYVTERKNQYRYGYHATFDTITSSSTSINWTVPKSNIFPLVDANIYALQIVGGKTYIIKPDDIASQIGEIDTPGMQSIDVYKNMPAGNELKTTHYTSRLAKGTNTSANVAGAANSARADFKNSSQASLDALTSSVVSVSGRVDYDFEGIHIHGPDASGNYDVQLPAGSRPNTVNHLDIHTITIADTGYIPLTHPNGTYQGMGEFTYSNPTIISGSVTFSENDYPGGYTFPVPNDVLVFSPVHNTPKYIKGDMLDQRVNKTNDGLLLDNKFELQINTNGTQINDQGYNGSMSTRPWVKEFVIEFPYDVYEYSADGNSTTFHKANEQIIISAEDSRYQGDLLRINFIAPAWDKEESYTNGIKTSVRAVNYNTEINRIKEELKDHNEPRR